MPKLSATTIASPVYHAAIAVNIPTYPPAWDNPTFPVIAPTPSRKKVIHSNRNVMNNPRFALNVPNHIASVKIPNAINTKPIA